MGESGDPSIIEFSPLFPNADCAFFGAVVLEHIVQPIKVVQAQASTCSKPGSDPSFKSVGNLLFIAGSLIISLMRISVTMTFAIDIRLACEVIILIKEHPTLPH